MSNSQFWRVGLVGYGEVGRILAEDLRARGVVVGAFDLKLLTGAGTALREHAAAHGVTLADSHAALAASADCIVSAVTASQTVAVAEACAPTVGQGAFFRDFNSASPGAKQRAAALMDAAATVASDRLGVASATKMCRSVMVKVFQRVIEHGRRRSEEVREVAETVRDAGLFGARGTPEFARSADWRTEADRLLDHVNDSKHKD